MSGEENEGRDGPGPVGIRAGQADAFDAIGDRYDEAFPHKDGQLAASRRLADELPPGSRVLDLGCGTGLPTARLLTEAGHQVTGVDLSPVMLGLAERNVPGAEFHRLDIREVTAERLGTFDGAAAFFSLLMLPRDDIPPALRMLHAVLRPQGLLALSMVEADADGLAIPFLGTTIRVSAYPRDALRDVARDAGFDVVGEESITYAPEDPDVPPEIQLFLHCRRRA